MPPHADKKQDPMTLPLATFRRRDTTGWDDAWVGMEPTFQSRKSIKKWHEMAARGKAGEDAYFEDDYMLGTMREVAKDLEKKYERMRKDGDVACVFAEVKGEEDLDQWGTRRQNLVFRWADKSLPSFRVRFTIDPETFEYSIKPVPLAWFYDERFVRFLDECLFEVPLKNGLEPTIAHGGAQFSFSAKTFLTGSLLADDIATRLNHPELSLWLMDWPNPDDRAFRATAKRREAFRTVLEQYWAGAFHPKAMGVPTVESCLLDRGWDPCPNPPKGLVDSRQGPKGTPQEVFQTNFAFGRAVRLRAQNVHPGYWQAAGPKEDGYRPDQIMRYGEGNLNRLQIAGELHVKSGKVLDPEDVAPFEAPLEPGMLYSEASWEDRGQMGRTSAKDFVEALLLDVHAARWLQAHPHVKVKSSILQDQLLGEGEETLRKHAPRELERLKKEAVKLNAEASGGRMKTDFIEPETLMWACWAALPVSEKGAIAREVISSFLERVSDAASCDPRPAAKTSDPMEWHRHRVHPVLWKALDATRKELSGYALERELEAFQARRKEYLDRRPKFTLVELDCPWRED